MKPLIVSTFDIAGGAARAAHRLCQGLRSLGLPSEMLVQYKTSAEPFVLGPQTSADRWVGKLRPTLDALPLNLYAQRDRSPFSVQWVQDAVQQKLRSSAPDVVNLHWISGYIRLESLATWRLPIVWTLHDMAAFTGGCHYSQDCLRYQDRCGACPQLHSDRETDLSRWVWQRKAKAWQALNLALVTPSAWLASCARDSSLFADRRIEVIPNSIDLQRFKPIDRAMARQWLNLPTDKRLVLFGAASANQPRKGWTFLQTALQKLSAQGQPDIELVVFGAGAPNTSEVGFPVHALGNFHDEIALALIYAAADVFVAPSTQDNLPNTVMEALACGTPCVAFDIGGMPEMIEHERTGYLAAPFDPDRLAAGIAWVLADRDRWAQLGQRSRQKAEAEFAPEIQAGRYAQLFAEVSQAPPSRQATEFSPASGLL